jgi:hydroxymethylbilane synthase
VNATTLRLGSRRSPMAIAQSRLVAQQIRDATGCEVEIVGITTLGDVSKAPLTQIGGTGVFVSALREALLNGEVDLAVHSLKDLPAVQPDQIALAAVPTRDDPRDALVARDGAKLADLPTGARVGGSQRRAAQLLALRADLRCVQIRGNAETRMGKINAGELDAVVLAYAGLARIGRLDAVTQVFEPDEMLPAPGQGALAVECRQADGELARLLSAVNDAHSMAATTAERGLLEALAAGCSAPVGAYAVIANDSLYMRATVMSTDGTRVLRAQGRGIPADARRLGGDIAADLLRAGAAELIRVPQAPASTGNDV